MQTIHRITVEDIPNLKGRLCVQLNYGLHQGSIIGEDGLIDGFFIEKRINYITFLEVIDYYFDFKKLKTRARRKSKGLTFSGIYYQH